jgi:hypothetical protein
MGDTGFDLDSLRYWHGCLFEFTNAINDTPNAKAGLINYCLCKEVLTEVISKEKALDYDDKNKSHLHSVGCMPL